MKKYYSLVLKALTVSLLVHYLFIMYFPIEWLDKLSVLNNELTTKNYAIQQPIEVTLVGDLNDDATPEQLDSLNEGDNKNDSQGNVLDGIDQEKWGDLIQRLEENTGFKSEYSQTLDDIVENNKVSSGYIHRDRKHEDIVVKDVFPTIHTIDQPFEEILKVAPEKLNEYVERDEIIEQFRSKNSDEETQLTVNILSEPMVGNLGPLTFTPSDRQKYFDETLAQDKTKQLSNFIDKYFQYDPNEGDLPIATRELYSKNLERLLYTFSTDPTYFYLDFYLENLNKEDFLHNAIYQASRLDGSKTATELLFAIERIYEIQQRAWGTYFDFEIRYQGISSEKRDRLRVETLHRVNKRYKQVLQEKGIKDFAGLEKKYRQRRYEIIDHIVNNTPKGYRLEDAIFERAAISWDTGVRNKDEKLKQQAINHWKPLIKEARRNNFSEEEYENFSNLPHLRLLEALLQAYRNEPKASQAVREKQISNLLIQRNNKRLAAKREREARLLWPK